ncbi:MAG: glycosyl transferase family 28, partial [Bacteroidales bacterium]|nr:glycosyl transferase family 28 [Bacteroidales bacterium]
MISMKAQKILISPLNWGFGHAGRMIPVALELRRRGHEIVFAADSSVLTMLASELPDITVINIPGVRIRYFRHLPQYLSILLHLPHIVAASVREHFALRKLAGMLQPDIIISDNRFGFYHKKIFSVYVTHMIRIPFPSPCRFLEPVGALIHRKVIERFDLCLIPDFPGEINLSGRLSHGIR